MANEMEFFRKFGPKENQYRRETLGKTFFLYNYIFYIIIFFKTLELKVTSKQNVGYGF